MPKIEYQPKKFRAGGLLIIEQANNIIDEYRRDNLNLTLRQLYYQFVSRDLMANKQSEYNRLGSILSDARLAGLVDWNAIEDRTRNVHFYYHNSDPGQAVQDALNQYKLDKWANQPHRVEVWIEKEALTGVISRICSQLDVPYFACRGYNSQSEMWRSSRRLARYAKNGQTPVIIHLGDHDPSGIDMTRDMTDRAELFARMPIKIERIALNYDQVVKYNPPPNPTKLTDTRATEYIRQHGASSWELDALEPRVIQSLIRDTVAEYTDQALLNETLALEQQHKSILETVVDNWETL